MKKLLLILLLPIFGFGQSVNTFPWVNDFENFVGLEQDQNDFGDWWLMQGSTSSNGTGPNGGPTQTLVIEQAPLKIIAVDPNKKDEKPYTL